MSNRDDTEVLDLGPCCACGRSGPTVRNLMMLDRRAPVPGTGWGCMVCNLPQDGATAVICDECLEAGRKPERVFYGFAKAGRYTPVANLEPGEFTHDLAIHRAYERNFVGKTQTGGGKTPGRT